MHILVLGGYGLIGLEICRELLRQGHQVTGLGRRKSIGERYLPTAKWIGQDISKCLTPEDWIPHLANIDIIVNASGALQSGLKDNVSKVQQHAMIALIQACEHANIRQFIQISAPNVSLESSTEFYRSKAAADHALKDSKLKWVILRPGLVIAPQAYGGTKLLRQLAAFPFVQPLALAQSQIKTVSVKDVAKAVHLAIQNNLNHADYDLMEDNANSLRDIILVFRRWMGFPAPLAAISIPTPLTWGISKIADSLGWLGWRSPLRSTAIDVLQDGVDGDSQSWSHDTGHRLSTLEESLASIPATTQERTAARADLLYPVLILLFSVFWIISGLIGLWQQEAAMDILAGKLDSGLTRLAVIGGSFADIAIGIGLLIKPWLKTSAYAAIIVSLSYMVGGLIFAPHLWADPLGPLVKILPVIAAALTLLALTPER